MLLSLEPDLTADQLQQIEDRLRQLEVHVERTATGVRPIWVIRSDGGEPPAERLTAIPGVAAVLPADEGFPLASLALRGRSSVIRCGPLDVGGQDFVLAAGPCAVETPEQMEACALATRRAGGVIFRGGSFKPRTSPYTFQGLGREGLRLHREVADRHGLLMMSEVLDREDLPAVAEWADILQVGSRNMQNFPLLKAIGRLNKPVLLKRGLAATREEFLLAAEYILAGGNERVILCERGIRSFDPALRNSLDLASVVLLKEMTHLPVFVDPSHATGRRRLVAPMARAAAAVGADGLLVEIHPSPESALSDGPQALLPEDLLRLAGELADLAPVVGRRFPRPA